jgi:phosphopantothenoylcysteine decarboxylase/phosphopantothenate--cysteine ligase
MDGAILCAAVADFTAVNVHASKLKRENENLVLELKPTIDIAASLGKIKSEQQFLVGFALETNNEEFNAKEKMKRKNFDFIVLNSLNDEKSGFGYDTNKITIFDKSANKNSYDLKSKEHVADDILKEILKLIN